MVKSMMRVGIALCLGICLMMYGCTDTNDTQNDLEIITGNWEVLSIKRNGQVYSETAENSYILEFTSNDAFTLSLDVNNCYGQYALPADGHINFDEIGCTYVCCDSEFAEDLVPILRTVSSYSRLSKILVLMGDGQLVLKQL